MFNVIKNRRLFMAILAVWVLAFSRCLVKAEDVAVPVGVNNEVVVPTKISDESINMLKFNPLKYNFEAEGNVTDDEINSSRMVVSGSINLTFNVGSNSERVVATYIFLNRILEELRSNDIILKRCFRGAVARDELIKEYRPTAFNGLSLCRDYCKIGEEEPLDFFYIESLSIKKGEMEAINALMKDEATRNKILKPITKEEFDKVINSSVKELSEKAEWWRKVYASDIKDQTPTDDGIKNEILCCACSDVEWAQEDYYRLKIGSLEGLKAKLEWQLKCLAEKKDENFASEEAKKQHYEEVNRLQNIINNSAALEAEFNERLKSAEKRVNDAKAVLNNPEKLNKMFEEAKANWKDRGEGGLTRAKFCDENVEVIKSLKFEGVRDVFGSFSSPENLKNFDNGFISINLDSARQDMPVSRFEFDLAVNEAVECEKNCKYEKIIFRFPQNMHPLARLISYIVAKDRLAFYFKGLDGNVLNDPNLNMEDGKVYKNDRTFLGAPGFSELKNLLDGKDVEFSFKCMSKDAANFNSFNVKLPEILKNILIKAPITREDVVKAFAKIVNEFGYSYFGRLDSIIYYRDSAKAKDISFCEPFFSDEFNRFASLFAPSLGKLLEFDKKDENIKKQFLDIYNSIEIECLRGSDRYAVSVDDSDINLDEKRQLLLQLLENVENFDVNSLNSIEQSGDSRVGFDNLISNGGCCVCHADIKLKNFIIEEVLKTINGFVNNSQDGFGLAFEPCENDGSDSVKRLYSYGGFTSNYAVNRDVSLIKAINKSGAEFEAAKGELKQLRELFKFFSEEGNVKNLTPMQRRVFFSTILFIVEPPYYILNVSADPFKNAPNLEVSFICNSSAKFAKYIEFLIGAIDEKLASLS